MNIVSKPLTNGAYGYPRGQARRKVPYVLAVVHQTSNTATAQSEWTYANRPNSDGPSATYYIDKDGSVIAAVDGQRYASWSSGDLNKPDVSIPTVARIVNDKAAGYNPNEAVWDQYECCGYGPEPWTDEQFETVATLIAARARVTGLAIDRTTVLAHRDINTVDRATDPWPDDRREARMARLIDRANAILKGDDVPGFGFKITGVPVAVQIRPNEGHLLINLARTEPLFYGPYAWGPSPNSLPVRLIDPADDQPIDVNGNKPPVNGRDIGYLYDADGFGRTAFALASDCDVIAPAVDATPYSQQQLDDAVLAEYNRVKSKTRATATVSFPDPPGA